MPRRRNRTTPAPTLLEEDAHHHDNCTTCGGYKVRGEELFWKSKAKNTSAAAVAQPTPKGVVSASKSSKASIIQQAGSLMEKIHEKGTAMVKNAKTKYKKNTKTKDEPPKAAENHAEPEKAPTTEPTADKKKVGHSKQNTQSAGTPTEANSPKRDKENDSSDEPATGSADGKTLPESAPGTEDDSEPNKDDHTAADKTSLQDTESEKESIEESDPNGAETKTANETLQEKEKPLPASEPETETESETEPESETKLASEDTDKKDKSTAHSDNKPPSPVAPKGQQTITNKDNKGVVASNCDIESEDELDKSDDQPGDSNSSSKMEAVVEENIDKLDHSDDEDASDDAENAGTKDIIHSSKSPSKGSLVEPTYGSEAMQKLSAIVNAYATTDHSTRIIIDVENNALPSNAKIQG